MSELIIQITALLNAKKLDPQTKQAWTTRLPSLSAETLQDLLAILQAKTPEELDNLQQKNLVKLNDLVKELKTIAKKGVQMIYKKGEEIARQKEKTEEETLLAELGKV